MSDPPPSQHDNDHVVIIAWWDSDQDRHITIQDFYREGRRFIPLFSDEAHFKAETAGLGFDDKGIVVLKSFLREILVDDPALILNPGSDAIELAVRDL